MRKNNLLIKQKSELITEIRFLFTKRLLYRFGWIHIKDLSSD